MAEFSGSGITGLPATTPETLAQAAKGGGDPRVLAWCYEAVQEGDRINRDDPSYDAIERGQQYVAGAHGPTGTPGSPDWLPKVVINESRKAMQAHVSALTDLKPTFGFKSSNPAFEFQQHLLNNHVVAWWISTAADHEIGEVIKYAFAGGSGDCVVEWDPYTADGGNTVLKARDPRDTLPIRPPQSSDLQLWQGLTLREEHTINVLRQMYPAYAQHFRPASDSILSAVKGRFRTAIAKLISPAADTLSGLTQHTHSQKPRSGTQVLYKTFLADQTRNLTPRPIAMGDPTSAWTYIVKPGERLYPHKRLIVWTENLVLYDGPAPYWHDLYPVSRLRLWSLPWQFLGVPLLSDLTPLQDQINESHNDIRLAIKQWLHRGVKYDRLAVSESTMRLFDSRKPGARLKMNQGLDGGLEYIEGPNPMVIAQAMEHLDRLTQKFESLAGTANLQQLMQLRQLPSADTIQKYYEALTPEIRYEGRMVELFLRPLAEMWKVNLFQFMTHARRIAVLGDAGLALKDFDHDPGVLIPAQPKMIQVPGQTDPLTGLTSPPQMVENPEYIEELDESRPQHERAQFFHKLFVFTVAPNSLLAMHTQEQKMMRFQLARMGYYDFWSLMSDLEVPNAGTPPAIPLPPLTPPSPEEVMQAQLQALTAMAGMPIAGAEPSKYIFDPATGQILEIRVPMTVTERLIAQQMMGIGMTENPAGRKASGGAAPKSETKSDGEGGQRQTVTESKK